MNVNELPDLHRAQDPDTGLWHWEGTCPLCGIRFVSASTAIVNDDMGYVRAWVDEDDIAVSGITLTYLNRIVRDHLEKCETTMSHIDLLRSHIDRQERRSWRTTLVAAVMLAFCVACAVWFDIVWLRLVLVACAGLNVWSLWANRAARRNLRNARAAIRG